MTMSKRFALDDAIRQSRLMLKSIPSLGPGWIEAWDEEKAMGIETHGIRTSGARENRLKPSCRMLPRGCPLMHKIELRTCRGWPDSFALCIDSQTLEVITLCII
jgi:hypothetical protein